MAGSSTAKNLPEAQRVNESLEVVEYIPHDPQKLCGLLEEYCNKLREYSLIEDGGLFSKIIVGEKRSSGATQLRDASALYTFILKQIIEVASPINANSTGFPASLRLELNLRLVEAKALLGYFDWEGNS